MQQPIPMLGVPIIDAREACVLPEPISVVRVVSDKGFPLFDKEAHKQSDLLERWQKVLPSIGHAVLVFSDMADMLREVFIVFVFFKVGAKGLGVDELR